MTSSSVFGNAPANLYPQQLIDTTLQQLRQQSSTGLNPLYPALHGFAQALKQLPPAQQKRVRQTLMAQVCQTQELSTRFVLRLMSDLSEAVYEGRELPYLIIQPQGF